MSQPQPYTTPPPARRGPPTETPFPVPQPPDELGRASAEIISHTLTLTITTATGEQLKPYHLVQDHPAALTPRP